MRFFLQDTLKNLSSERRREAGERLVRHLAEDKYFLSSTNVMLYYSMSTEVPTTRILELWYATKKLYLPAIVDGELRVKQYIGENKLCRGQLNIWEPTSPVLDDASLIDYILVPGVGFDYLKNRLGHGKAYYDRFLMQYVGTRTRFVGVAFKEQIVEAIPTEEHDIRLHDLIIV